MTLDDYIKLPDVLDGVDVDHAYGNQCWDLVEDYAERVLDIPRNPWAITLNPDINAKSAWLHYDQNPQLQKYFDKIPKGQEQKGDITVYDGHGIYTEGHIAICLGGGQVFEQNADPNGSLPHVYLRATTYLLGSLRKKGSTISNMTKDQAAELALYIRLLAFESVEEANSHSTDDVNHILADPAYAGGIAKAVYQGEWQMPAYKAGHYDADVAAAAAGASNATQLKPGNYVVK